MCPDRAFTCFAVVAPYGVLGNGLAAAGQPGAAAALAAAALAAWLALTCLVPARLAAPASARPPITAVNGTWYLWPVATQSLAIAAAFVRAGGLLPPGLAAAVGIAAWSAGVTLYAAVMVLVVARLLLAGPGPADAAALAPYWVAMGAASISAFAAARILHTTVARPVITGVAVILWAVATGLIPVLATLTARWLRPPARPRYRPQAWAIVFPLGMYAMAGLQLGTAARLPLIHHIGAAAVRPAAAAWAVTFTAMVTSPLTRQRHSAHTKATHLAPAGQPPPRATPPTASQDGHRDEEIQVPGPGHAPRATRRRP